MARTGNPGSNPAPSLLSALMALRKADDSSENPLLRAPGWLPRLMFVIAFIPRTKHLLFSWLQSPSAVNLESKKIKSVIVSIVSPSICLEVMGPDAMRS